MEQEQSTNPWHLRYPDDLRQPQQDPTKFDPKIPLPATAYTCLNALKHGGTAESMFIGGENPDDFHALLKEFFEEYKPGTTSHSAIVQDYCRARWMLWRRQRAQSFFEFVADAQTPLNAVFSDQVLSGIERYDRYLTQADRAFKRAFANVEAIRKDAVNDERWRLHFDLQVKRFEITRAAFEQVQSQRARAAAKQATADEAEAQRKREFEEEAEERRQCREILVLHNNKWLIQQTSFVKEENGNTFISSIVPSNDDVRKLIESRDRFINKPEGVSRTFFFADGPIPVDYLWVIEDLDPATLKASSGSANPAIRCTLDFPNWENLAETEAALLSHQAWEAKQQEQQQE